MPVEQTASVYSCSCFAAKPMWGVSYSPVPWLSDIPQRRADLGPRAADRPVAMPSALVSTATATNSYR